MLFRDPPDEQESRFVIASGRNLDPPGIVPEDLRLKEVNPVLGLILLALARIELKLWHGVKCIPFLRGEQVLDPSLGSPCCSIMGEFGNWPKFGVRGISRLQRRVATL